MGLFLMLSFLSASFFSHTKLARNSSSPDSGIRAMLLVSPKNAPISPRPTLCLRTIGTAISTCASRRTYLPPSVFECLLNKYSGQHSRRNRDRCCSVETSCFASRDSAFRACVRRDAARFRTRMERVDLHEPLFGPPALQASMTRKRPQPEFGPKTL